MEMYKRAGDKAREEVKGRERAIEEQRERGGKKK